MSLDITFHYALEDKSLFEVAETASDTFISLFDCDAEVLKLWDLWPEFIRQYREATGPTFLEQVQEMPLEEAEATLRELDEKSDEEEPDRDDDEDDDYDEMMRLEEGWEIVWESQESYAPAEVREWAKRWIHYINEWDPVDLPHLFPYAINLETGKSTFDKAYTIRELNELVAQADCALRHGINLQITAIMG